MERGEDSTKKAFADAYRKLLAANTDRRVTVKDIALAAGYDRHTFYYHFRGISDLVLWIFNTEVAAIIDASSSDWSEVLRNIISFADSSRKLVLALYLSTQHSDTLILLKRLIVEIMRFYIDSDGRFSWMPEEEKARTAAFIAGGCTAYLGEWLKSGMEKNSAAVSAELLDMAERALLGFQSM